MGPAVTKAEFEKMERAGGGPPPFTWYRNLMELGAPVEIFVSSTM